MVGVFLIVFNVCILQDCSKAIKMTEETATNVLVNHTMKAVIASEMFCLGLALENYSHCVADQMSEGEALRMDKDKFIEAFVKGWEKWKRGEETQAMETFFSIMK